MKNKVRLKLDEIAICIINGIKNNSIKHSANGLYDGKFGILLFLYYYSKYSKNNDIKSFTDKYAEVLLDRLWGQTQIPTFCSGLSGILYLFVFLKEQNFIDIDIDDAEIEFNNYLTKGMDLFITGHNYDFMHGALGIGLYFNKLKKNNQSISKFINFLYDIAEKNMANKIFKWKSVLNENGDIGYNIALSHGISSIVIFLSQAIENNIKHIKLPILLEGAVNYLLSQEIDYQQHGSYFPSQALENKNANITKSRLAWCYGDLGIAYSIWYAGIVVNKKEWIDKGTNILLDSTKRKSLKDNYIVDAGLCHGSAGIAMIYNRMYTETKKPLFLEASNFWINQTLLFSNHIDGLSGYKTMRGIGNDIKYECDYSLLTGISGIGLMFVSYLMNDTQAWDEIFLLS